MEKRRFKSNLHLLVRHPLVFARIYRLALGILLIGAVLDAWSTYNIVCVYGHEAEVHPVARLAMHWFGPTIGTWGGKVVQTLVAIVVASLWRRWCGWLLSLAGLLYMAAAVCNHFLLL